MLTARGHGLHTCRQQAWVSQHKTAPLDEFATFSGFDG